MCGDGCVYVFVRRVCVRMGVGVCAMCSSDECML